MQLYLVRHAHAGQRLPGGRDRYRPLSPEGRERAAALADLFTGCDIDRLLSSPATRCQQTLETLAASTGQAIEDFALLWEGSDTADTLSALESLDDEVVVACSHGDIIPALIDQLAVAGVPVSGRGCELGSIWVVERDRDRGDWAGARYVGPRATSLD
jgi:8-oxo-dGTP diphosphatase